MTGRPNKLGAILSDPDFVAGGWSVVVVDQFALRDPDPVLQRLSQFRDEEVDRDDVLGVLCTARVTSRLRQWAENHMFVVVQNTELLGRLLRAYPDSFVG